MRFTSLLLLCVFFSSCSNRHEQIEAFTRYTNTPTMGDAARAGGEKPF